MINRLSIAIIIVLIFFVVMYIGECKSSVDEKHKIELLEHENDMLKFQVDSLESIGNETRIEINEAIKRDSAQNVFIAKIIREADSLEKKRPKKMAFSTDTLYVYADRMALIEINRIQKRGIEGLQKSVYLKDSVIAKQKKLIATLDLMISTQGEIIRNHESILQSERKRTRQQRRKKWIAIGAGIGSSILLGSLLVNQ